jgi:hypothetical protein
MPTVSPHTAMPNIGNLRVGRGYLKMKLASDTGYVDIGNCTEFTFQVKPTLLPHFSSRLGVRKKDLVVVTELEATLTMTLEEITARNFSVACLGSYTDSPPGTWTIDMFSEPLFYAALQFTDTSAAGPQWQATFPNVLLTPAKAISLISQGSGAWSTIDLQADVLFDNISGQFATFSSTDIASP